MTNSKVLVKNDKVIVTEWSFNVGDSTGTHKHQYNYVVVPMIDGCLLYTSPSPRDGLLSRMPSSA